LKRRAPKVNRDERYGRAISLHAARRSRKRSATGVFLMLRSLIALALPDKMTHGLDHRCCTRESTEREFVYGGAI